MRNLLRRLRYRLTNLCPFTARFDSLQNQLDALASSLDSVRREIRNKPSKETLLELIAKSRNERFGSGLLEPSAPTILARESETEEAHEIPFTGPTINRIGFLVQSPELLNHFGSVFDLLPPEIFDVLIYGKTEESQIVLAQAARWKCKIVSATDVLNSGERYRYLVSNHPVTVYDKPLIRQLGLKNVRFMYSAGKSGWNLRLWNALYDLILCFGPYHAAAFAECSDAVVVQMGYPRFDKYFSITPGKDELRQRFNCEASKETVVWLPTWKSLSSVGWFSQEIADLSASYNVVVKLHPLMVGSEPDRVEALKRFSFTSLILDTSDNTPLYSLADFLLCDYGGPPLAGIYTDKNLLLLNVPDAEGDELTGENSPDLEIRKHIVNVNAEDGSIARILADRTVWEAQKVARRMLRRKYFAPYFGFSSQVAASTLLNLDNILGEGD